MPNKAGKPSKKRAQPRALAPPESRGVSKATGAQLKAQPADGEEPRAAPAPKRVFPIVAVGASAGGLEAFSSGCTHGANTRAPELGLPSARESSNATGAGFGWKGMPAKVRPSNLRSLHKIRVRKTCASLHPAFFALDALSTLTSSIF
jgi:hypothetical protein